MQKVDPVKLATETFQYNVQLAEKNLANYKRDELRYRNLLEQATQEPTHWWQFVRRSRIHGLRKEHDEMLKGINESKDHIRQYDDAIAAMERGNYELAIRVLDRVIPMLNREAEFEPEGVLFGTGGMAYRLQRLKEDLVLLQKQQGTTFTG